MLKNKSDRIKTNRFSRASGRIFESSLVSLITWLRFSVNKQNNQYRPRYRVFQIEKLLETFVEFSFTQSYRHMFQRIWGRTRLLAIQSRISLNSVFFIQNVLFSCQLVVHAIRYFILRVYSGKTKK